MRVNYNNKKIRIEQRNEIKLRKREDLKQNKILNANVPT